MNDKHKKCDVTSPKRRLPGIHWLMIAGIAFIAALGITTIRYISSEIEQNTLHNRTILERSKHIEIEASRISNQVLPAYQSLHSLDISVNRHVAEFELYVLDVDRDRKLLADTLSRIEHAFDAFPDTSPDYSVLDRSRLEEVVGVFIDITHEAMEVQSPNMLLQLLMDSEDIFAEFRAELDKARDTLDQAVDMLGVNITKDLQDNRENLSLQQKMLRHLEETSRWGLSLLGLTVLLVAVVLFRGLQRRLTAVAEYAHSIAAGDYSSSITLISRDKIGDMAESVSHMGSTMAALIGELGQKAEIAKCSAREARRLAYYDSLTGLPNRQHFIEKLESALRRAGHAEEKVAVAYLDLDGFKKINDSYGHGIGDQLLCAVADRLTHSIRDHDTAARNVADVPALLPSRLGGDEFTFLIDRIRSRGEAEKISRRILNVLIAPYHFEERDLTVTPSIGVAVYPDDASTVDELLKHSDMAMYQAKESGRNTIKLFNAELSKRQFQKIILERDLSKALERGELTLHYQAKVDLHSRQIVGAEALLRWQHPQRGMVPPADFIPLAEESGLILPIGDWVIQQACDQLLQWQSDQVVPVPIAINISAKQFARGNLPAKIKTVMEKAGISAVYLELELTESILMQDTKQTIDALNALGDLGVRISLDDFGTGYSSLSYLKRFPLNTLKIDRSFVQDIETDTDDVTIIKAILALSNSLGLKAIAEGVESKAQEAFLRKHGCQEAQGYLFSKPIPAREFSALLVQGKSASVA